MFSCYDCKNGFADTKKLILHYKFEHGYTDTSTYTCFQYNCLRIFPNKSSFEKHLLKHKHGECSNEIENDSIRKSFIINEVDVKQQVKTLFSQQTLRQKAYCREDVPKTNDLDDRSTRTEYSKSRIDLMMQAVEAFKTESLQSSLTLLHMCNSQPSMTEVLIQKIVTFIRDYLTGSLFELLKNFILEFADCDHLVATKIDDMFNTLVTSFDYMRSKHMREKYFKSTGCYIESEPIVLGHELQMKKKKGEIHYETADAVAQYIPIGRVLKTYLELPGNFDLLKSCMLKWEKESDVISNFCQGTLWKGIKLRFVDRLSSSLILYYDDYNVNNVLGSHKNKNKIGGVYYFLPALPTEIITQLDNIFVAMFFKTSDRVDYGNEAVFSQLLDELEKLENEGISVTVGDTTHQIYFCVGLLVGDNLGLHSWMNFVEGFSARFPCRMCKASSKQIQNLTEQDDSLMRTVQNYDSDLQRGDASETGINSECIFNRLTSFHAVENKSADMMHDLFLGVCRYDLPLLLNYVMEKYNISLNALNSRIISFDYGTDETDKPPALSEAQLDSDTLTLYASEMKNLILYLPLILGDVISEEDEYWKWFLLMRQIVDILLCRKLELGIKSILKQLVSSYLKSRIQLFPNETIKYKHHQFTHYPDLLEETGPYRNLSCTRFEAKHRIFIAYANNSKSRTNVPFSLARKSQHMMACYFLNHNKLKSTTVEGRKTTLSIFDLENYAKYQSKIPLSNTVTVLKWLVFKSYKYKPKLFVTIGSDGLFPTFGKIHYILLEKDQYYFVIEQWETVGFDPHIHSYNITPSDAWIVLSSDQLSSYGPISSHIYAKDGLVYIMYYN